MEIQFLDDAVSARPPQNGLATKRADFLESLLLSNSSFPRCLFNRTPHKEGLAPDTLTVFR